MTAVTGVEIQKIVFIDELAFHHAACPVNHCGHIADVADIAPVAVLIGHPTGLKGSLVLRDSVVVVGEVSAHTIVESLHIVFPTERKFHSTVGHLTEVLIWGSLVAYRRIDRSLVEYTVGDLIIEISLEGETVVEHAEFKSDVGRSGRLPCQCLVGEG